MDKSRSIDSRKEPSLVRASEQLPENSSRRYSYNYGYAYSPIENEDANPSGGILEYWHILRSHKGTWIMCAFLGTVLGFLVTLPQTPVYQAHTTIEIQGLNENFMNMRQTTQVYEGAGTDGSEIPTQIKILQSESLLERVVNKLKNSPSTADRSRIRSWRRLLNIPEPSQTSFQMSQLAQLVGTVRAQAAGQTRVIEITADCSDPALAAAFLNTLSGQFIEQNLEARWKSTENTAQWLGHQLDDMRIKLEKSEDALQQYARQSGLLFTSEKTNVSEERLKQLQQQLSEATNARIGKQSAYELAQKSSPESLPDVMGDENLHNTAARIRDLRGQIADLSAVYTSDYAKVKRAEAELSVMQSIFERDRAAILGRIKNEFKEAVRREELLDAAYRSQFQLVSGEGAKSIQYGILKREVDSNRQLYDAMLAQLKQSSIASAMRASNVRVVDPAKAPTLPYKPDLKRSAMVGTIFGAFLGAALIIVRSRADRTIQQPGESAAIVNLPELGIIPAGKHEKPSTLPNTAASIKQDRVELVTWQRKPSHVAESFRSALLSILFSADGHSAEPKSQSLVLTSPGPSEGKSTVTSNLAIAISEVGRRVLLIDADMRRPRQHEVFCVENKVGLSTLLRDKTPLNGDRTLGGLILKTEIPGLWLLPSGPRTSSATNLLYSKHMADLVAYAKQEFDTVLIDTPPMLQIPDARVVGRLADSVIMVVRAQQTTRDAVAAACQRFLEDGTSVMGTILNDWDPNTAPNGYYGYNKPDHRYETVGE